MAKAQSREERLRKVRKREEKNKWESMKGKGKGKGPSTRDPDFEHAGVAIAVRNKWINNLVEVREVSGRIMDHGSILSNTRGTSTFYKRLRSAGQS